MARFGDRIFNVKLRKARSKLAGLLTTVGVPLPANTLDELRRDMAQLHLIRGQIKEIEKARLARLQKAPQDGAHPMLLMLAKVMAIGLERADMLVHEGLSRDLRDDSAGGRY